MSSPELCIFRGRKNKAGRPKCGEQGEGPGRREAAETGKSTQALHLILGTTESRRSVLNKEVM